MKSTTVKCMVRVRPLSAKETRDGAEKCVLAVGQQVNNVVLAKSVKIRVFHGFFTLIKNQLFTLQFFRT